MKQPTPKHLKISSSSSSSSTLRTQESTLMALPSSFYLLLLVLFTGVISVSATVLNLENRCGYTIWPGILSGNGAPLGDGGFPLPAGASVQITPPAGWSGRLWARTGCTFDASGIGNCITGDCGGVMRCAVGGTPPATLAEFTVAQSGSEKDFYDVSLVDGYNVGVGIKTVNGSGDCQYAGCLADLNAICPYELRVMDSGSGTSSGSDSTVACRSACSAFNTPEFCCSEDHATPQTCPPTHYSETFKSVCPSAYSYAYDDASSLFTCYGPDYLITFCPTQS